MCGIVGYFGQKQPTEVLLNGLQRLEYRGYDSAGVAVHDGKELFLVRAQGKLAALTSKLEQYPLQGQIGIGHTRWATHGVPSESNAHPHKVQGVCVVHNGIIENYVELKQALISEGCKFSSDTDSEVVAHLISQALKHHDNLLQAVNAIIPKLEGAYAVLAMSDKEPENMVAFKHGPPLLVGYGKNDDEALIASDAQAIIDHTNIVSYLNDGEVAYLKKGAFQFFAADGTTIDKDKIEINWDAENSDKLGYKHYMLKEIFEQPRAVANVLEQYIDKSTQKINLESLCQSPLSNEKTFDINDLKKIERFFIVACGTSYYAGMYGEYLLEQVVKVPVEIDTASEFRYRQPVIPKNSLVVVISQSGETADTLAVLRQAKEAGAKVLSITNTKASTIDREADGHLYMHAGVEIGVASTKAFTSTLTVLNLFSIYLARLKDIITAEEEQTFLQSLLAVPSHMEAVLSYDAYFSEAAKSFKSYRGFLYLGRGTNYPIAMEGALKLKELAYMHAEGYAAGEMKHGPLALISDDMLVVVINPKDQYYEKTLSNLQEAKARGGVIVSVGTGDDEVLKDISLKYLSLPQSHWMASGLLAVLPMQLLAYHVADVLEYDVDQPRNLAKSVTVE